VTPKVLLTATNRWPCAARLAIGLSKAGCNVSAVCPTRGHPLLKTRAVRQTFPYSGLRPLDSLVAAIEAADPQIIIPCDDPGVQHLHELYARERSLGTTGNNIIALIERSLGAPESFSIVSSRFDLLRIAREEGLRVPDTNLVNTLDDLKFWRAGQTFPWVLKADGTWGGRGVKIAHTPEQAEQLFLELTQLPGATSVVKQLILNRDRFWLPPWGQRSKPAVIVQSHIQGRPANCAVVCWKGKVLAGIGVDVVSAQEQQGPASVVRVVDNPEMMLSAERIARRLGLSGFFGLDFMIEYASGATYLIEMNPRGTPLCHLRLGAGADMVGALAAQLSGQPYRETPPVTQNDMIAYFPQAWTCDSGFLQSSFQDVPREEPDLMQELLHPWSERSLVGRIFDRLRRLMVEEKASKGYVFATTTATRKSSEACQKLEGVPVNHGGG
jgi:hypothetical protein